MTDPTKPAPTLAEMIDAVSAPSLAQMLVDAGAVLDLSTAQLLLLTALMERPSCDTWDEAYGMCLADNGRSLFRCVALVDEDAESPSQRPGLTASERWRGYYPDPMTVLLALNYAANHAQEQ